jgi:hypothetical protein
VRRGAKLLAAVSFVLAVAGGGLVMLLIVAVLAMLERLERLS